MTHIFTPCSLVSIPHLSRSGENPGKYEYEQHAVGSIRVFGITICTEFHITIVSGIFQSSDVEECGTNPV